MRNLIDLSSTFMVDDDSIFRYYEKLEGIFNFREPDIQAFIPEDRRFGRLREEIEALLRRFPHPQDRPPLFGIPFGVKDIFHASGFSTRAGSKVPVKHLQGPEAEVVSSLKAAGALILGKTVTTEFAYFAPGPTRNPADIAHTPGGSSSGSAAAVAAGYCPFALGTQTIGSIIRPASFCGVVGFKPTYDRISRAGVIPLSPSVDHVGLFTRDFTSMSVVAEVLCRDWVGQVKEGRKPVLGIPDGPYLDRASAEGRDHFRKMCQRLEESGYQILAVRAMEDFDTIYSRHQLLVAAEAAVVHRRWFSQFENLYHPKTAALIREGQTVSTEDYEIALLGRERLRRQLTELMDEQKFDLWVSPSSVGPAPKGLDSTGDPVMNLPWTYSGMPTVNLPGEKNQAGLPMGIQLTARWNKDEALLVWGTEVAANFR